MAETEDRSIVARFADLSDPRAPLGIRHSLEAILTIALCAVLCGADTWVEMAACGLARRAWCATVRE